MLKRIEQVAMAIGRIHRHHIGGRNAAVFISKSGLRPINIENDEALQAGTVELEVGVPERVFPATDHGAELGRVGAVRSMGEELFKALPHWPDRAITLIWL